MSDELHFDALCRTGYWGAAGAGCLIRARTTGHVLLPRRSAYVLEPGTWGVWGGAVDPGESPAAAAAREAGEETGIDLDPAGLIPLYVHQGAHGFRYTTFLAPVEQEFVPVLDWESDAYLWTLPGRWPRPLHFGLAALLADPRARALLTDPEPPST